MTPSYIAINLVVVVIVIVVLVVLVFGVGVGGLGGSGGLVGVVWTFQNVLRTSHLLHTKITTQKKISRITRPCRG